MKSNLKYLFLTIMVLVIALLVRMFSLSSFSPILSVFRSYIAFSDYHTLNSGHLVEYADIQVYDQFSGQLRASVQEHAMLVLRPMLSILTGINTVSWMFEICLFFAFSIPFILFFVILARKGTENNLDIFIITAFALMACPTMIYYTIYWNCSLGYLIIVILTYIALYKQGIKWLSISILFGFILIISYFTAALALLTLLITIYVISNYYKNQIQINKILLFYIIMFITYTIFISISRFNGVINFVETIASVTPNSASGVQGSVVVDPSIISSTDLSNKIRMGFNAIFVVIPFLYFILIGRKSFLESKEKNITYALVFFLIIFIPLTYFVIGGVGRAVEYGTLVSLLLFTLMAGKINVNHWKILRICVLIAVISSIFAYTYDENIGNSHLTFAEQDASGFLSQRIDSNNVTFSDYRIAAPLISKGFFKTTGINMISSDNLDQDIKNLEDIYWDNNGSKAAEALMGIELTGQDIDYILFSDEMTKPLPGIRTYTLNLKPAEKMLKQKLDSNSAFSKFYYNGDAYIYSIR